MSLGCPHCRSLNIARKVRRGIVNKLLAHIGQWPYRCASCGRSFHAGQRQPSGNLNRKSRLQPQAAYASPSNTVQMAYRTDAVRPYAKIVLAADTHDQMDAILLALSRSIASYGGAAKEYAQH